MTKEQLDAMEAAARKRLQEWINRAAAQHVRAMRKGCANIIRQALITWRLR